MEKTAKMFIVGDFEYNSEKWKDISHKYINGISIK